MSTSSLMQEDEIPQYDDISVGMDSEAEEDTSPPAPKFAVFEKVYAKDNTTPLLYEAVVRKMVYAPLAKKMNVCLVDKLEEALEEEALTTIIDEEPVHTWHYFVHYQGWAPRFDRWIDEHQLFKMGKDSEALAKRLKEASKSLKRGSSAKKVTEMMHGLVRLEQELREKQAKGETIDELSHKSDTTTVTKKEIAKPKESIKQDADLNTKNHVFIERERKLRKLSQCSKKASITLPFTIKKVLTEDWEIISQCEMVHNIPASKTVMDALNHYLDLKLNMIRSSSTNTTTVSTREEKKEDDEESVDCLTSENHENISSSEQEWIDMVKGLALFFDQSLPKHLLYRQEIPQCVLLEQNFEKRHCELYPCEHLVRMCMKIPDQLTDSSLPEEEKAKVLFKIGDLLRFLQKNQGTYLLQRYRNKTVEENVKAAKMKKQLGLGSMEETEEESEVVDDDNNLVDEQVEEDSLKKKKVGKVAKGLKQVSRKRKK